jgi:hypothetical protein
MRRPDFESDWKRKMKEIFLLLCFLHCCLFIQLFLLSASLASSTVIDRTCSLHVTTQRLACVMKQAGTNHIELFKPGWSRQKRRICMYPGS